jgi:hypothetical protein
MLLKYNDALDYVEALGGGVVLKLQNETVKQLTEFI